MEQGDSETQGERQTRWNDRERERERERDEEKDLNTQGVINGYSTGEEWKGQQGNRQREDMKSKTLHMRAVLQNKRGNNNTARINKKLKVLALKWNPRQNAT